MKNKKINKLNGRIIIILMLLLIAVIGGTFAWFTFRSRQSALVLTIGDINDSKVIINPYEIRETMIPANIYTSGVYSQVTAINNNSNEMGVKLFYKVNQLDDILIDNGLKYTIASSNSINGEYTELSTGDFKSLTNDTIVIFDDKISSNTTAYYRVYLWLDSDVGEQTDAQNSVIDIELNGTINISANKPVLDEGMVPVTISDDGTVTTISENNANWYDYDKQKWANIVLVNENATESVEGSKSREYYLNNPGTPVIESDILAYYVWIPRYKYKIWTTTTGSSPQTIDILFESPSEPKSTGTTIGEYLTHPAFTFGNKELPGLWVGKFEIGGDADTPKVKPNIQSLVNQNISTQFQTSLKFSGGTMDSSTGVVSFSGNNTYGLTSDTDSHMMKNSEWGSVAYLSHSSYGINKEIRINNYYDSGYKTGCGAISGVSNSTTTCGIIYGTPTTEEVNSYPQSTTGNISGIFDISGGAWEYVMGNYNNTTASSGFSSLPESKYYNLYMITEIDSCSLEECGGHSLYETSGWYEDSVGFISPSSPWFGRGGSGVNKNSAGAFNSGSDTGRVSIGGSWRSVLVPLEPVNIIFESNGGNNINSINVPLNAPYGELPIPERFGYEFLGWYTEIDGGELITEDSIVNVEDSITLYAHWELLPTYTISYDANGGSGAPSSQTKIHGETLILSSVVPTREGYDFLGWDTDSSATSATYSAGGDYTTNADATLYAVWEMLSPVESYYCANGSKGSEPYLITYTGNCEVIDDGNENWRIKFLTDGTFTSNIDMPIDTFLVGGGGGGSTTSSDVGYDGGGGGGGGYTLTSFANVKVGQSYSLVIGTGGSVGGAGGNTTGFGGIAYGGYPGLEHRGGTGGSGGGSGGYHNTEDGVNGGSDGENGTTGENAQSGNGQGVTTREFGESTGDLYSGGGGGGSGYDEDNRKYSLYGSGGNGGGGSGGNAKSTSSSAGTNGTANTGGGGGGGTRKYSSGTGGSGIIVIRNARNTSNNLPNVGFDFTYDGYYAIVNEGSGNWKIKFLTSGTFRTTSALSVNAFLVGGGGGGGSSGYWEDESEYGYDGGGGGGGGYTTTLNSAFSISANSDYVITIGGGGNASRDGSATTAFNLTANGGKKGSGSGGAGGSGGGGGDYYDYDGGDGGTDGSDGTTGGSSYKGGTGQKTTTREFGESGGTLYSGGGGGGGGYYTDDQTYWEYTLNGDGGARGSGHGGMYSPGNYASPNTGGGGGGGTYGYDGGIGGSGIVIIRNAR